MEQLFREMVDSTTSSEIKEIEIRREKSFFCTSSASLNFKFSFKIKKTDRCEDDNA